MEKILTAPDDSSLQIMYQGRKIGYCRWQASVHDATAPGLPLSEGSEPEGRVRRLAEYAIHLEGNILSEETGRFRFELHGTFATNLVWKDLSLRVSRRPDLWEVRTSAEEQTLTFVSDDGESRSTRRLRFADLNSPERILRALGYPIPPGLLGQLNLPLAGIAGGATNLSLGLRWEARHDWHRMGNARVRVYRLQTRLLDRHEATLILSRVGEILRVELPQGWSLVNEALIGYERLP